MVSVYFVTTPNERDSLHPHYLEFIKSSIELPRAPSPNTQTSASVVVAKFGVSRNFRGVIWSA